jgi:hypothetical protein
MSKCKRLDERQLGLIAQAEVQEAINAKKMHSVKQIQDLEDRIY